MTMLLLMMMMMMMMMMMLINHMKRYPLKHLCLNKRNGFDREKYKSIARQKNQASEAISKNSKSVEGISQILDSSTLISQPYSEHFG